MVAEPSGERIVLMHADASEISTLNPVGAMVWAALPATRQVILDVLVERFGDEQVTTIGDDLDRFLNEMLDRGLIVSADAHC